MEWLWYGDEATRRALLLVRGNLFPDPPDLSGGSIFVALMGMRAAGRLLAKSLVSAEAPSRCSHLRPVIRVDLICAGLARLKKSKA